MDEAQYYSEGNFMTYRNGVRRFIEETQARASTVVTTSGVLGFRDFLGARVIYPKAH